MTILSSQLGGAAIKSIQRGTIASGGGTATITSVNTSKTELRFLGCTNTNGGVVLTNSTTVTGLGGSAVNLSWELTEYY